MMNNNPLTIGISGGSGSGKTRFAKELVRRCNIDHTNYISQDSYYRDLSHLSYQQRCNNNFDSPNSIDFDMLYTHISELTKNKIIEVPVYDFKTHTRMQETHTMHPKSLLIVEGIFALFDERIRDLLEIKIFIDTPSDIRALRRVKRDINKRGRSIESIINQYTETVRPMHKKYVAPIKVFADIIILNGGKNKEAIDVIESQLLPNINERIIK